jgi:CubicO group peptidase (beta-lactamase class C family)
MATAPLAEDPEVRSAIDLLEAWVEAQRVARDLPGLSIGIVHDQALVWSGGFGWADVARREPITIRHLLTHTSGLPREGAFPYFTDGRFPGIDEIRARLPMQERPLPTETRWKYSNLGATLAGEVVAAVAREPYGDFVRRRRWSSRPTRPAA